MKGFSIGLKILAWLMLVLGIMSCVYSVVGVGSFIVGVAMIIMFFAANAAAKHVQTAAEYKGEDEKYKGKVVKGIILKIIGCLFILTCAQGISAGAFGGSLFFAIVAAALIFFGNNFTKKVYSEINPKYAPQANQAD